MKTRDRVLFIIVLTYPILDMIYSINYQILGIDLPINQSIRVLILIYLLFNIKRRRHLLIVSFIFLILFIGEFIHARFGIISFASDLSYISKILFFVVTIYGVESIIKEKEINYLYLIKDMVNSGFLISVSIILSKFGLGLSTWGEENIRSGVKGLFTVQNTVNATLLILMPLCFLVFYKTKKIWYAVLYILMLTSTAMIGTKSGLAGSIVITVSIILYLFFKTKLSYLKIAVSCFSVPLFLLLIWASMKPFSDFINEQISIYYLYGYSNPFSFLISNRDLQLSFIKNFISSAGNFQLSFLFGIGYSLSNQIVNIGKSGFKAIEMDFYGIYYYSGALILLIIIAIIGKRYIYSILIMIKERLNIGSFCIFISLSVGIVHSYFGGHVIYEALTSLYFGSVLTIANLKFKKMHAINRNVSVKVNRVFKKKTAIPS